MYNLKKISKLIVAILLFAASFTASGQDSSHPRISLECKEKAVQWVLSRLEEQTGFDVLIRSSDVDMERKVSLRLNQVTLDTALTHIFDGTEVKWSVAERRISIFVPQIQEEPVPTPRTLQGVVKDREGNPIIGAMVMIVGTATGTSTEADGSWKLVCSAEKDSKTQLRIGMLGYETVTFPIGNKTDFDLVLQENVSNLDEVVVVAYGVQKKSLVTAAISSVDGENLAMTAPTRLDNALKGMVSGVSITASSGQPGAGTTIRIRGTGTINDSDPLYIVDGMPVSGGIEHINPADIASIEVLKDAASAAIYGSRGANGVILVTTKSGKDGKVTVNYNFSCGFQNPWRKLDMLNASEYATIMNEMNMNDGLRPIYEHPQEYGEGTDWQDEVFNKNALIMDHQASISGGNSKGNYYLSASYLYHEGIIGGNYNHSNYDRLTLRSNVNQTLFDVSNKRDWLNSMKIGVNISYSHDNSRSIPANSERGSVLGSALALSPILPVYAENPEQLLQEHPHAIVDKNGRPFTIASDEFANMPNPLAMLNMPIDKNKNDKVQGNAFIELSIWKGLKFKSSFGGDLDIFTNDGYELPYYLSSNRQNKNSSVWSTIDKGFMWQVENTLSYQGTFAEKHNLSVLLGQSASSYESQYVSGTSYKIRDSSQPNINATDQDAMERSASGSPSPKSRLASYFFRFGYNFDERYMLEFTFRRDGSSNFSPHNKWANFPSVSIGWNITNEPFMKNRPRFLTSIKLRASWGMNGNQNIGAFRYTSMMSGGADYILGIGPFISIVPGAIPSNYINSNLKWEQSEQTDVGLDVRLFENRLSFGLDWYLKRTNGMLMAMSLPGYIGNPSPIGNVGDMKNTGLEFDIAYKLQWGDWDFNVGANCSYNKNRLIKLGNETASQNYDSVLGTLGVISRAENGEPFPFFYGWKTAGIFQDTAQVNAYVNKDGQLLQPEAVPGDVIFVDYNGDGVIDDRDRTKLGKGMPDWTFGFNIGASWKGIDISALFHATVGNDIYDATLRTDYPKVNLPSYMLERWIGPGSSNHLPRLTSKANGGPNTNWRSSDLMVHDGSFLRLRSLQLGYTLPQKWTSVIFIQRLRFYFSAENLFTSTRYHGFDPEISSGGTSLGIDRGIYPQPRILSFGANVTF